MNRSRGGDESQIRIDSKRLRATPIAGSVREPDDGSDISGKQPDGFPGVVTPAQASIARSRRRQIARTSSSPVSTCHTSTPLHGSNPARSKLAILEKGLHGSDSSSSTAARLMTREPWRKPRHHNPAIVQSRASFTLSSLEFPKARETYLRLKRFIKTPGSIHAIFGVVQYSMGIALDRMPAYKATIGQPNSEAGFDLAHLKGFISDFRNFLALGDLFAIGKAFKAHYNARYTTTDDHLTRAVGYIQHIANAGYSLFEGPSILAYRGIFRMSRKNAKNEYRKYMFVRASCWFWAVAIAIQFFEIAMDSLADRRVRRKIRERKGKLDEETRGKHRLKRQLRLRKIVINSIWAPVAVACSLPVNPLPMSVVNWLNAAGKGAEAYAKWKDTKE